MSKETKGGLEARQKSEREIVARAWSDAKFRAALLKDPKSALEKVGVKLPAGMTIVVHEEKPGTLHLVLPVAPSGELSEAELETVAGGPTAVENVLSKQMLACNNPFSSLNFTLNFMGGP